MIVRDIPHNPAIGGEGLGDLYLPDGGWQADTPVVLQIHGGGWAHGDRKSWSGVARFFTDVLGFASFNIEYRLASENNPWPACAGDCIHAAKFLLSKTFAATHGLKPERIWICGGSAGGHLALWTGLSLPPLKNESPNSSARSAKLRPCSLPDKQACRVCEVDACRAALASGHGFAGVDDR